MDLAKLDSAKLRVFVGVGGALVGFAGVVVLSAALALALSVYMGVVAATVTAGLILLAISSIFFYLALRPQKSSAAEVEDIETATAGALADLPFDTVKSMVEKRPLVALGVAAMLGYSVAGDTDGAMRDARRLLSNLL